MADECHICGEAVATGEATAAQVASGFICADCGEVTCDDCKSIGVARSTDHCKRCRG